MEFTKTVGEAATNEEMEGTYTLVGEPEWVTLPESLGGKRLLCLSAYIAPCACGGVHLSKWRTLEQGYLVVECESLNQFMWLRHEGTDSPGMFCKRGQCVDGPCRMCGREPRDEETYGPHPEGWDHANICASCWDELTGEEEG